MGNIVGENFDPYVVDQVNIRQNILGLINRTNEQLVWENSKTSWIKLVSSTNLVDSDKRFLPNSVTNGYIGGPKLAERFVLFNGVTNEIPSILPGVETVQRSGVGINNAWSGNNAYGLGGSDFGLQPMPGILSATIKTETRGTLKTGTVNIKANNKQQFEIINTLYLRLGYMMLLEWGNSCYYDNKGNFISDNTYSLADPFLRKTYDSNTASILGTKVTYNNLLKAVEIQREKSCGNYDALIGKVVNFNWVFNKDGSYDITIIIRSTGDVIESLKVNTLLPGNIATSSSAASSSPSVTIPVFGIVVTPPASTTSPPSTSPTLTGNETSEEVIQAYAQNNTIAKHFNDIQQKLSTFDENVSITLGGTTIYKDDKKTVNYFSQQYSNSSPGSSTNQYYVRLGAFLQFLENSIIPTVKGSGRLIDIDTDLNTNRIHTLPNQISADPRICVFRKTVNFYTTPSGTNTNSFELFPPIEAFNGRLMNVYFNMVYILKLLNDLKDKDGKVLIINLLNSMMTGFCKATGNYNKISTRVNIETNQIVFIDETVIPNRDQFLTNKSPVQFNVYGFSDTGGSFVRDLQLKTGITPDLATMVTIGATAAGYVTGQDATLLSNLNKGTIDRIKPEVISPPATPKNKDIEENKKIIEVYKEAQEIFDNFVLDTNSHPYSSPRSDVAGFAALLPSWNEDLYSNFTNTQVQLLEYEQKQSTNSIRLNAIGGNPYASSPNSGFLPFDLNLTMDGISGIKIYQKYFIDSRFLPANYPETMEFIIIGVSNTIQNNIWITNIESYAIPRSFTNVSSPISVKGSTSTSGVERYIGTKPISLSNTVSFLTDVLKGIGISNPNQNQIYFIKAWRQHEGGRATWNPFNTTLNLPGSTLYNDLGRGIGVRNYVDRAQGLQATISTLKQSNYAGIVQAIKNINNDKITINKAMEAVNNSNWGSDFIPTKWNYWGTLNNLIYENPVKYT